ncbi:MAG: DUF3443 family protein [Rhodoferax sp.]|uniref:DUF3443 family protein n=1 Tax=Rhodoferax sp. TaxID=50421 RepID=UPI00301AD667
MYSIIKLLIGLIVGIFVLASCGGGGSSTTLICKTSDCTITVGKTFVQQANNLEVVVDGWVPAGTFTSPPINILFASVTVCAVGARPTDPQAKCTNIDHVQVDTGSVGLRILASKVSSLGLTPILTPNDLTVPNLDPVYECYPFVVGGLWGPTAVADVRLGEQWAQALQVQLIQDIPSAAIQAPTNCSDAAQSHILSSASQLGSNGILGIGSVPVDCGLTCQSNLYPNTYVVYYTCPAVATSVLDCRAAAVDLPLQVHNPVDKLSPDANGVADNNGVVLILPPLPVTGANKVLGELVFGIDTRASDSNLRTISNKLDTSANKAYLGVDPHNSKSSHGLASYLNVTTQYVSANSSQIIYNSYLDTGTNALFFTDGSIPLCTPASVLISSWYCPDSLLTKKAIISDGDVPGNHAVNVDFLVGNASKIPGAISAYSGMAGAPPLSTKAASFSWGLPFFYGRSVYMSIWDTSSTNSTYSSGPWYSF